MKRFSKSILIYLALLLPIQALTFWVSRDAVTICWDGIEVDEALLLELCGVTEEEFWEMDPAACPQSAEAITTIGGCEPDYSFVVAVMGLVALVYTLLFLGVSWFRHYRARANIVQ